MTDKDNITLPREVVEAVLRIVERSRDWSDVRQSGDCAAILRKALAAEQPKHPGYVIGSHWLETAYSRICAGEAEADVLRDCGWERVDDIEALRRDADRYKWMKQEVKRIPPGWDLVGWDAAIDAAMKEDKR